MTGSWKSSLAGFLGGIGVIAAQAVLTTQAQHQPLTLENIAPGLVTGVSLMVLGHFSKDKDVTGGTRSNKVAPFTPEQLQSLVDAGLVSKEVAEKLAASVVTTPAQATVTHEEPKIFDKPDQRSGK